MTQSREADPLTQELDTLITALEQARQPWEPTWDRLWDKCYPTRKFYAPEDYGSSKEPTINYSTHARRALEISSGGFQEYTANRRTAWMQLRFDDPILNKQYMVADWLEECQEIVLAHFNRSNFYPALGELVPDGHVTGGCMFSEEDRARNLILYRARHPKAIWYTRNAYGEIDIVVDEYWYSRRACVQRFGAENLHDSITRDVDKAPLDGVKIHHIVMPMDTRYLAYSTEARNAKMPFVSIWYDRTNKWIIDVGGYWEMPYTAWGYYQLDGEDYPRTPAMDALGEIYAVNQMAKSRIALGQKISDPPMIVDSGLQGQDYIIPGYHIYIGSPAQRIEPLQLGANYPITTDNEQRAENAIDAHFNIDLYMMLANAERQMTAREVIERMGEKISVIGYSVGTYEQQVLQPNVRRTFNILYRAGMLPPAPKAVLDAVKDKTYLKIEFLGRLSQLQRQYFQTSGLNNAISYVGAIGQMNQDSLDNVDFDELMRTSLESVGAPESVIREEDDVKAIRQNRLAQQAQLMQLQAAEAAANRVAQNYDKLAKTPQPGSPAEQLGAAAQ
jgi:hypothetical protein